MNDWWVVNMMFIIVWCIFSFTGIVRIIWSCWITIMLLVFIYVMCIYVVGGFSYMLMLLSCLCKHVMNNVGVDCWSFVNICIVVDWVICSCIITCCWRILCIQLFGLVMMCLLHYRVTTSELIWYHMHVVVVSRRIEWSWWVLEDSGSYIRWLFVFVS